MDSKKKFGLVMPKKSESLKVKAKSVFDSDSEDDAPKSKRPVIPQKKINIKNKIKEETIDPSIYEYDNIYDDMKAKQAESIAPKTKQNSRYIETLLKAADKRKKESERRVEKKIQIEREKEGDQFKDKEEFVTSAYKKKMLEREEEEERERREAMLNEMMDVTKQKDLSGFYRHFLKQTVGEEKVPKFGEKYIKQEVLTDEERHEENRPHSSKENCENNKKNLVSKSVKGSRFIENKSSEINQASKHEDQIESGDLDKDSDIEIDSDSNDNDRKKMSNSNSSESDSQVIDKSRKRKMLSKRTKAYKHSDESLSATANNQEKKLSNEKKRNRNFSDSDSSVRNRNKDRKKVSVKHNSHMDKKEKINYKKSNASDSEFENECENSFNSNDSKVKKQKFLEIHARHDSDSSTKDGETKENVKINKKHDESENIKKERKNIYAKRTVGDVFAEAQARYFQRMAERST